MKFGVRLRATPHVLAADTSMTDGSSNFKLMSCGCVNVQRDIVRSYIIARRSRQTFHE